MFELTRIQPNLPPEAVKTYSIRSPRDTMVKAVCEQVDCQAWRHGWRSIIDESTELGRSQAAYIRTRSRRTFREGRANGGLTVFTFEAGQRCFADHKTRPELYIVRGGDHRGNPRGEFMQHTRAVDWVDDCATHQQKLADRLEQG